MDSSKQTYRKFYRVRYLPDISLPEYSLYGIDSFEKYLEENESHLRELHSIGIISETRISYHIVYLFKNEWKMYFYIASDREDSLKIVDTVLKSTMIFQLFHLEECNFEMPAEYEDFSFLSRRANTIEINSLRPYEVKNYIDQPKRRQLLAWEADERFRWYSVLKRIEQLKSEVTIRLDIFPALCYAQWIKDTSNLRMDLKSRTSMGATLDNGNIDFIQDSLKQFTELLESMPCFYLNLVVLAKQKGLSKILSNTIGAQISKNIAFTTIYVNSNESHNVLVGDEAVLSSVKDVDDLSADIIDKYISVFGTKELQNIFSFPIINIGEYIDYPYECDLPRIKEGKKIILGNSVSGQPFEYPIENLKRHTFICGMTGSGKTRCLFQILCQLNSNGIPFLVVEPVKKEYRELITQLCDVSFFSPGAASPFMLRINPFEFPEDTALSVHIDYLMMAFKGAFYMPTPGPFILEQAIERAYRERGWFPNTINNYINRKENKLTFPELADIKRIVRDIVFETEYRTEFQNDMIAILQNRLDSLMHRDVGDLYNCRHSTITPDDWINRSVILELDSLSEADSNFLTLLLSIYIRESLNTCKATRKLRHVICYEEAHALLGGDNVVHSDLSTDNPNPKIAASQFMERMLQESRGLGEGIVISDQIPTHMPDSVIKNTDYKIVLRIVSNDDKNIMSGSISASDFLKLRMGNLEQGHAIMYYQEMKRPEEVEICKWADKENTISDDVLQDILGSSLPYLASYDTNLRIIRQQCIDQIQRYLISIKYTKADKKAVSNYCSGLLKEGLTKFPEDSYNYSVEPLLLICDFFELDMIARWDDLRTIEEAYYWIGSLKWLDSYHHRYFEDLRNKEKLVSIIQNDFNRKTKISGSVYDHLQEIYDESIIVTRLENTFERIYMNRANYAYCVMIKSVERQPCFELIQVLLDSYYSIDNLINEEFSSKEKYRYHNMMLWVATLSIIIKYKSDQEMSGISEKMREQIKCIGTDMLGIIENSSGNEETQCITKYQDFLLSLTK